MKRVRRLGEFAQVDGNDDGLHEPEESWMSRPTIFEHTFIVSPDDIDQLGHVNNVVYLRYAQDAAVAHWRSAVPKELRNSLVWVVRRHEIDYFKPALADDELNARTWVGEASGATMDRFVEIRQTRDGQVLAAIQSVWVALDAKALRPRRVSAELRSLFLEATSQPAAGP
jgi:acyl-CoA thioester hydrolase